jgi:ribosomal protein S18 acetylase RimI-like enzyme
MIETSTIMIEELNSRNIDKISELYEDFKTKSSLDYKFEIPPLEYEDFKTVVNENILKGFVLFENLTPTGFLLYVIEEHKAIELNIIYVINDEHAIKRRKLLLKSLLDQVKDKSDWNVISYPMLGVQENFVRDITLFGFNLIGQAIVKFKFDNIISYKILASQTMSDLPEGYKITYWSDEYFEKASEAICDTFKNSNDANFDPRFLTLEGSREVVLRIISNIFGQFLPESTSILLYNQKLAGICFANVTDAHSANVPLIGIKKEHKNKGFGKYLLKNTVMSVIQNVQVGKVYAKEVNAAVDTDNYPALRMYRKIGFREEYTYPHAYLKNPNFQG